MSLTLSVVVEPADYTEGVKKSLHDHRRNSEIRGFRKGMVPMSLIQKMYGHTSLVDEINKLMSEGINKYIEENQIKMIGEALPNHELQPKIDWDHTDTYTFIFDLILAPKIELTLSTEDQISYKEPKISKKDKDDYVETLCKQSGKTEMNQEFFDLVLGPNQADSLEVFMKKIEERMRREFTFESDYLFSKQARDFVIEKSAIQLPDALVKRWLHQINDGKVTMEEIERDYEIFARDFRWQLICRYLMKEHNLQVTKEEMIAKAARMVQHQFAMYGINSLPQDVLEQQVQNLLTNEKESHRIFEMVEDDKVIDLIRSKVRLNPEKISFSKIREMNSK